MNTLRQVRERIGLSQRKLGRLAGTTGQTIGRIEAGQFNPTPLLAVRIARVLREPPAMVFPELAELIAEVRKRSPGA